MYYATNQRILLYIQELLEQLRNVDNKYSDLLQTIMKENGMTIAEFRLVDLISRGVNRQDEIAKVTNLDTSTLSRQLKNAVNKEMIEKTAIGTDKRQLVYSLTSKGSESSGKIQNEIQELTGKIAGSWSDTEKGQLLELLEKLNQSLNKGVL